ncbi:MAG: 50S ribosomal protein L13 [Anaerolineales bacterium]
MNKTYVTKASDIQREWLVVDANGQNLGRLATRIATILLGKHKPLFTPSLDTGDFVIVVNAEKVTVTGNKLLEKVYTRYSGYPGGLRVTTLRDQLAKHPDRVITHAVWGMLPHNKLGKAMLKKLKVYAGPDHPHAAQNPTALK